MSKHPFEKFEKKEPTGARLKELIKQEKRKLKKEARAAGEDFRRKKKEERFGTSTKYETRNTTGETAADRLREAKPAHKARGAKFEGRRPVKVQRKTTPYSKRQDFGGHTDERHIKTSDGGAEVRAPRKRTFNETDSERKESNTADGRKIIARPAKSDATDGRGNNEPAKSHRQKRTIKRPGTQRDNKPLPDNRPSPTGNRQPETGNRQQETEQMPLNKYVAHSGVCGRREAAELVKQGKVTVNGSIIYEPGFKVTTSDEVNVKGERVFLQHNPVYILLNKPKDYLTTSKDPEGRKTVFDLVAKATTERVFPVGRLDRNTTGVLLLTNDGELAQKLTHPSYEIKKIYEVKLDKDLTKKDFEAIVQGVTLEDGFVAADSLAYADAHDKSIVGIEIHSGRNRIVRRIFEHLGYDVKYLDRVMFANLTKKNVDRGKYRFLSEKEVRLLKFMNQSFLRKSLDGKED